MAMLTNLLLYTIGHSDHSTSEFIDLLRQRGVTLVAYQSGIGQLLDLARTLPQLVNAPVCHPRIWDEIYLLLPDIGRG